MKQVRLILVGFGSAGQGLVQILREQEEWDADKYGLRFNVLGVSTLSRGSVYNPGGLSFDMLIEAGSGDLNVLQANKHGWTVEEMIDAGEADVLVEVSYTDLNSGEPATGYIKRALQRGMHVVTANKGPIALHYPELRDLARANNVQIGIEGTVLSGTPGVALGHEHLISAGINRIQGILNGTTNFILTRMEDGSTYAEALAEAQSLGYAEADPAGDVEGYDAAGKAVILANVLMGGNLSMTDIDRKGITGLTLEDIKSAKADGMRWKLIGTIEKAGDSVTASVQPTKIPLEHPLASVGGAINALTYSTTLIGEVTLIGPGAGAVGTGYALFSDLLAIHGTMTTSYPPG